jgi:antitoxin CptB
MTVPTNPQTPMADPRVLDRIRWRARRGLLENDLLLKLFLERELEQLTPAELETLDSLLQLGDNDLLDILMNRKTAANTTTAALVAKILAARH